MVILSLSRATVPGRFPMRTNKVLTAFSVLFIASAVGLSLFSGCGGQKGDVEAIKTTIRTVWIEDAWNNGNYLGLDTLFSPDYVYHNIPFADFKGLDAYKKFITDNRSAYPDIRITLEDIIVEGDKVMTRGTYQGTQRGVSPTMGITTGQTVDFKWCVVSRMAGGKFVESWAYVDYLGLRQQIGYTMIPPVTDKTFARVTITQGKPEKYEEQLKIYKESLVPAAKQQKGFRSIISLRDFTSAKSMTITIWESEADAIANEQSGYYKEQVAKFQEYFTAKPIREGYTVTVLE